MVLVQYELVRNMRTVLTVAFRTALIAAFVFAFACRRALPACLGDYSVWDRSVAGWGPF